MALVSSVPFHLKNMISMYDYFQVKTNGTPRKCWCIVFSCNKRLKISIFVFLRPIGRIKHRLFHRKFKNMSKDAGKPPAIADMDA